MTVPGRCLTSTGGVVTGLLAEESRVLNCKGACQLLRQNIVAIAKAATATRRQFSIVNHSASSQALHNDCLRCGPGALRVGIDSDRRTLRAEELARDVEGLAAHNNDLLTIEQLLSDCAGKAAEQVALAVDDLGCC